MTLTLRAVSLNDQPLSQPITARFDLHGGTIGRADHNTMALPDPERHISREQAEIIAGQAGYVIRNVGSSNPIVVRDELLAQGESAPLLHNDHVRIGRYLLEVIDDATPAAPGVPAPASDAAALWGAFCEGAGVRMAPPQGADPELMRLAGSLLRATVDGMLQLMAVRAAARLELPAQVPAIQARISRPGAFSPDAQSALEHLLQPPAGGLLPGPAAVTEAMDDLVGHAIGTMAGTRSALEGVLARLAPQSLEARLVGQTMLDSLLPMARKAKLWELFRQHYEGIRAEAQKDFHALFGKAFLAAYEQQLEQLRRERRRHR